MDGQLSHLSRESKDSGMSATLLGATLTKEETKFYWIIAYYREKGMVGPKKSNFKRERFFEARKGAYLFTT